MRFRDTAWFKGRPQPEVDDTEPKTQRMPYAATVAPAGDPLEDGVTQKIWTVQEIEGDPDELYDADDAQLTMQLRAVKAGRQALVVAVLGALLALGSGIALVL